MIDSTRHWHRILAVIAPLLVAIVELFHPHPHDLLNLALARWMAVHLATESSATAGSRQHKTR